MNKQRCFFIGHHDASVALSGLLKLETRNLILNKNITEFVIGKYGSFDSIASLAVASMKSEFPQIKIYRLVPYYNESQTVDLPDGFDGTIYPEGLENVPKRFAIVRANQYMIEHSAYLVCHVWNSFGNAAKLLEFAKKREAKGKIQIIRI
ncbi:MAG: hypothetical protein IIX93_00150 [Clostridia bacterium]|nr:hypothetical protein [Clostridia bacterium]MBQ2433136.1 hypothetical protein [Clostridia bacterium]